MIKINLLPFRAARKRENIRVQVSLFVLTLLFAFVVMAFLHLSWSNKIKNLRTKVKETKTELTEVQQAAKEVDAITAELKKLKQKRDVIVQLDVNRKEPVTLLDSFTQLIIPNRMWFTSLKASGTTVNLNGIALDNKTIADFMVKLENSPLFNQVNLSSVSTSKQGAQKMKAFGITCTKAPVELPAS